MSRIDDILTELETISRNPRAQLDACLAAGKKAVGVMPYFCPEELVYAAGMQPFGLWGADMVCDQSRRYYPAFICSILHSVLELGITGKLAGLSAIMIPFSCDSLKGMATNWEVSVKDIPVINVAYAQNRKIDAGTEFTASQLRKIRGQLAEIAGREITDADIAGAVGVYNADRAAILAFADAAGKHPKLVPAAKRSAVIKAGFFMDRAEHAKLLTELAELLAAEPEDHGYIRVVTTGILADSPALLEIFEENRICIAADQIAAESVDARTQTPVTEDPIIGMAERYGKLEGCSILFDPGKQRGKELVALAQEAKADGIIWVMTKFCDPEEYDFVPVKRMADAAGFRVLSLEVDRQMVNYEQIRSAVQAFAEMC